MRDNMIYILLQTLSIWTITMSEIHVYSLRSPLLPTLRSTCVKCNSFEVTDAANAIDNFYQNQPYFAAFMTCSFKASAADFLVQKQRKDDALVVIPKSLDFDFQRNVGFLLYGGIYQGCVQEYLYNSLFPKFFGDSVSWTNVLEQVATDMLVLTPLLCLPVAYMMKSLVSPNESLVDGITKYINHVQTEGLLIRYWIIWTPVQILTFGFVPIHLRIPFIALVSFFWLMILSNVSSRNAKA
jgi:protein Mpv17